jgi:hypothetical protein
MTKYFEDYYSAVSGVESTLSDHHFEKYFDNRTEHHPQSTVFLQPKTLSEIVKSTGLTHIDLLSLDVEGHEFEVLQSWDFSVPIQIILIETLGVQPDKDELCRKILLENNYRFVVNYKHNEIYTLKRI